MSQIQIPAPKNIATLVELLRWRAGCQPDELALSFLPDGERDGERMTYGDIDRRARVVAVRLRELGAKGERVLLVYPPGLHFVAGFFGCLYARAVAVPVFPPPANRPAPRLEATIASAQPALALCTAKIKAEVDRRADNAPYLSSLRWVVADEFPADAADSWRDPGVGAEDLAFLQYTSGSTASPRGVMLTHANLLHNLAVIARGFDHPKDSARGVSWLPFYHDMGLIGGIMQSLYVGGPSTLMPPVAFLSNPS